MGMVDNGVGYGCHLLIHCHLLVHCHLSIHRHTSLVHV
jgi:hypothetical protein